MKKLLALSILMVLTILPITAVQVIYEYPRNASPQDMYRINQMNAQSEQQQILRENLRIQQEMLNIYRNQNRGY